MNTGYLGIVETKHVKDVVLLLLEGQIGLIDQQERTKQKPN